MCLSRIAALSWGVGPHLCGLAAAAWSRLNLWVSSDMEPRKGWWPDAPFQGEEARLDIESGHQLAAGGPETQLPRLPVDTRHPRLLPWDPLMTPVPGGDAEGGPRCGRGWGARPTHSLLGYSWGTRGSTYSNGKSCPLAQNPCSGGHPCRDAWGEKMCTEQDCTHPWLWTGCPPHHWSDPAPGPSPEGGLSLGEPPPSVPPGRWAPGHSPSRTSPHPVLLFLGPGVWPWGLAPPALLGGACTRGPCLDVPRGPGPWPFRLLSLCLGRGLASAGTRSPQPGAPQGSHLPARARPGAHPPPPHGTTSLSPVMPASPPLTAPGPACRPPGPVAAILCPAAGSLSSVRDPSPALALLPAGYTPGPPPPSPSLTLPPLSQRNNLSR